eukprot:scaffold123245_cov32-Tisochrysis_lutea.AAC.2
MTWNGDGRAVDRPISDALATEPWSRRGGASWDEVGGKRASLPLRSPTWIAATVKAASSLSIGGTLHPRAPHAEGMCNTGAASLEVADGAWRLSCASANNFRSNGNKIAAEPNGGRRTFSAVLRSLDERYSRSRACAVGVTRSSTKLRVWWLRPIEMVRLDERMSTRGSRRGARICISGDVVAA